MNQSGKYSFPREERLRSTALINRLFSSGRTLNSYPFRIYWDYADPDDHSAPLRAGFTVPKRNFRRAVDRNLLKRRLREAYRLNKYILSDQLSREGRKVFLMILYLPKEILVFNEIHEGIKRLLNRLCHTLNENVD